MPYGTYGDVRVKLRGGGGFFSRWASKLRGCNRMEIVFCGLLYQNFDFFAYFGQETGFCDRDRGSGRPLGSDILRYFHSGDSPDRPDDPHSPKIDFIGRLWASQQCPPPKINYVFPKKVISALPIDATSRSGGFWGQNTAPF